MERKGSKQTNKTQRVLNAKCASFLTVCIDSLGCPRDWSTFVKIQLSSNIKTKRATFVDVKLGKMATKYTTLQKVFKCFIRLAAYTLYLFCWMSLRVLDYISNAFVFKSHQSTMKSAKLGRIMWRQKLSNFAFAEPFDFICLFRTSVKPEYVLQPNVSLYSISAKEAIFVETPTNVNIYSSDVHPFFFHAQFRNATKVIKMSIKDFVSLAEKIGDPRASVMWMSNTGRCGGTMLSQIFETVPETQVIHEPSPPSNVFRLREYNRINEFEYEAILKSMFRIMCKPYPRITRIIIKPQAPCTFMMTDICKLCPDVRHIFIYRNSLHTIRSTLALLGSSPFLAVIRTCIDAVWFSNIFPGFRNALRLYTSERKYSPDMPLERTTVCILAIWWANQMLFVRKTLALGQTILLIKYEDIKSRPKESIEQIFDRLEIDSSHTNRAVNSLSRDSQRDLPISRDNIGDSSFRFITENDRINCDVILTERNLPRMGEDFRL